MAGNDIIQQVRYEPDADLHFEGDGEVAYGTKFVIVRLARAKPADE